jgi:hypothetical protein
MNPREVKTYVAEHYPNGECERIEWIDDTSANLIFASTSTAQDALVALASVEIADATLLPARELLPAKAFSQKAGIGLQVRMAVEGDRKQPRAAERSRFYLLNPEYDPENRKRYRDRDDGGSRSHRRRYSREDERGYTREDEPRDHFDVNLYDDDAAALATRDDGPRPRRRRSCTPNHDNDDRQDRSRRGVNRNKELFPDLASRRDRSASPMRDRDGDHDMAREGSVEHNRRGARAIKDRLVRTNRDKELFPAQSSEDNRLDDAAELTKRFALPLYDGSHDERPAGREGRLVDRVTARGGGGGGGSSLADRITDRAEASGFSIRGAATQKSGGQGITIKGASKSARELFPEKLGGSNAGKELFADKVDGRSRRRQRAGDLFD